MINPSDVPEVDTTCMTRQYRPYLHSRCARFRRASLPQPGVAGVVEALFKPRCAARVGPGVLISGTSGKNPVLTSAAAMVFETSDLSSACISTISARRDIGSMNLAEVEAVVLL